MINWPINFNTNKTSAVTTNPLYGHAWIWTSHKNCTDNRRKPSDFHDFPAPPLYIYQASVTTKDNKPDEAYVGLSENTFQTRFVNHKTSFNNHSKRMSIELSKHVWNLKESNINFRITSKILKQDIAHNPSSKRCNLCLWEKYFTICKPHLATLNKRNELVSSCRHASKFLFKKIQLSCYITDPIETALYP